MTFLESSTGSQTPTRMILPDGIASSEWEKCRSFAKLGGIETFEWQDLILKTWLASNGIGRWAAMVGGLCVPRQNGKTLGVTVPRIAYGMASRGEQAIYTAHLQKTSTETFEAVASFFDRPKMRKHVKAIRTALGRESVELNDRRTKGGGYIPGGRIKFLARTRSGGRGQHGDVLVFDEALELSSESQSSFLPAISASRNPQTLYLSTPPTEGSDSAVFYGIRGRALGGVTSRTSWHEWGVDEVGDVNDRRRWFEANPSAGILINEETMAAEAEAMEPEQFACERLGWWRPEPGRLDRIIDSEAWAACETDDAPDGVTSFGVKMHDGEAAISACVISDGRPPYVELIKAGDVLGGVGWVADWLNERADACALLAIDSKQAEALTDRLAAYRPKHRHVMTMRDAIDAASLFVDGVNSGELEHYGQEHLTASATGATKRILRGGAACFGSGRDASSVPVESAAAALWAAKHAKRKPGRKSRIL